MSTPRQTATEVMDFIPVLMRLLRKKFREKRIGDLSMAQFRTLAFIDANQGASLSESASHIGLGLPSMSKLVDALVTRKFLTRETHGRDRRRICLALTRQGKRELTEAYKHAQRYFTDKFAALSDEQRAQVLQSIDLLRQLFQDEMLGPDRRQSQPR